MAEILDTPRHRDLIFDVGMHKGEDAEFYLRKGFRVVGFEADPDLVAFCRNRLGEYLDQKRLMLVEGAILGAGEGVADRGRVPFYKSEGNSVWGTVLADWAGRNARLGSASRLVEVDAVDFSAAIREHGMPYYMKIDVEGLDLACVRELARFRERPDYVSIESDKLRFGNIRREIDTLAGLGYDRFQAVEQSALQVVQSPPDPPREGRYVPIRFEDEASGLFGAELPGVWQSRREVLRRYRAIRLGYLLLGDDGVMNPWQFRGAERLKSWTRRRLRRVTEAEVPGWYDTHARHHSVELQAG